MKPDHLTTRLATNAWHHRTTQSLFRETCALQCDKTAVVYPGGSITYEELQTRVDRTTTAIMNAGIGKGDVVSLLPSPTVDFAIVYFAVLQSGATVNPLNLLWGVDDLRGVIARNAPKALIMVGEYNGRDYVDLIRKALWNEAPGCLQHLLVTDEDAQLPDGFRRLSEFVGAVDEVDTARITRAVDAFDPADPQFICQTSGSTGYSKSAVWNHRSPLSTSHFVAANLGFTADDKYMNLAPFFHNSGICVSLSMCLAYVGMTVYYFDKFDPDDAVRTAQEEGIVGTFGFAAHWQAMRASSHYDPERFRLNKVVIAGDAALYAFVSDMCPSDAVIANLYAQTENGPLVSFTELSCVDESLRRHTSGRPLPGVRVQIRDLVTGEPLPDGRSGEIHYTSPYLFLGYLQDDGSLSLPLDEQGYFASGDYGKMVGGYLTYAERLGGIVKSGGENVSLANVTAALNSLFKRDFERIHAVSVRDEYWGDRVVAIVKGGSAPWTTEQLRSRCKEVMATYEVPQNFIDWPDEWPISAEGKINTRAMERFASARLSDEP